MRLGIAFLTTGLILLVVLVGITMVENESLSKRLDKRISHITMIDIYPIFSKKMFSEHVRRRRGYRSITIEEFLEYFSVAFRNDLTVIFSSTVIALSIGLFVPVFLHRNSVFLGYGIAFIPVFLVLSLVMYFLNAEWLIYSVFIGILSSARLLTVLSTKISEVEKDDYVIFSLLGGRRRFEITLRYTYPQVIDSMFSASFWTFVTIVGIVVSIPFLGLSNFMSPSSGLFLFEIYKRPSSLTGLVESSIIISSMLVLILSVYLILRGTNLIAMKSLGIRFGKKKTRKLRKDVVVEGDLKGITVESLKISSKSFGITLVDLDHPVRFDPQDKIFVMGPSGSGKTIFTGTVLGMIHDHVLEYEGKVEFEFEDGKLDILRGTLPSGITFEYIPQNPRSSFDKYTPVKVQLEDLGIFDEVMNTIGETFGKSYLEDVMKSVNHPPSEINDGTLQILNFIVAMERVKKSERAVVLFDEPIASLARKNVSKIIELLKESVFRENVLVFWIGHEIEMMDLMPFNKILIARVNDAGITTFEIREMDKVREVLESLERKKEDIKGKLAEYPLSTGDLLYDVKLNELVFDRNHRIVYNINNRIKRGEIVLIEGDNGTGKSSLLKALIGYYRRFIRGEILYHKDGKLYSVKRHFRKIWKDIDVVFQNPESALPKFSRADEIVPGNEKVKREMFEVLGLSEHSKKRVYQLSYGQKKRLMLARAILKDPSVMFLDEPTASLDYNNILAVVDEVQKFKRKGAEKTVFFITHDPIFNVLKEKNGVRRITLDR